MVAAVRGNPGSSHNLCLFFGGADNLRYFFGDKRDFADGAEEMAEKYGDTCISIQALSSGSMLVLFFKS